jgi:DNA-binding MarR family transcriptional regulator
MTLLLLLLGPTQQLGALLGLRRKLDHVLRNRLVAGTGLSVEQASILAELEGTIGFASPAPRLHDAEGFIAFNALASRLVLTKPALSRRLAELVQMGLVEQRSVLDAGLPDESRPHGNAVQVRITSKGRSRISRIIERMTVLASELFGGVSPRQQKADAAILQRLDERLSELLTTPDRPRP